MSPEQAEKMVELGIKHNVAARIYEVGYRETGMRRETSAVVVDTPYDAGFLDGAMAEAGGVEIGEGERSAGDMRTDSLGRETIVY